MSDTETVCITPSRGERVEFATDTLLVFEASIFGQTRWDYVAVTDESMHNGWSTEDKPNAPPESFGTHGIWFDEGEFEGDREAYEVSVEDIYEVRGLDEDETASRRPGVDIDELETTVAGTHGCTVCGHGITLDTETQSDRIRHTCTHCGKERTFIEAADE